MTATAGYIRTERDKLITQLAQACQLMTLDEIRHLLAVAHGLNEVQNPPDGAP